MNSGVLAVTVATGASPNLPALLAITAGAVPLSNLGSVAGVPASTATAIQAVLGPVVGPGAVTWVGALTQPVPPDPTFPSDIQLVSAVGANGTLAVAAFATQNANDALLALTIDGITSSLAWAWPVPATPVSPLLASDARANVLASQLENVYLTLVEGGGLVDGGLSPVCTPADGGLNGDAGGCTGCNPEVVLGFEFLPFNLCNGWPTELSLVETAVSITDMSSLIQNNCAYQENQLLSQAPSAAENEAVNAQWDPGLSDYGPASGNRWVTLGYPDGGTGCVSVWAHGDNRDTGSVTLDGVVQASFDNCCATAAYHSCSTLPGTIALQLQGTYDVATASVRMVLVGPPPQASSSESPDAGLDHDPEPLVWTFAPGWSAGVQSATAPIGDGG